MVKVYDFHADWCSPCQMMKPIFDKVADEMQSDEIAFEKINVDEEPELAGQYQVASIPCFVIVKEDGSFFSKSGPMAAPTLKSFINSNI